MPDPTDEEQLISIRNLYEEICREADEDGERDDVELALIARVGKKISELEAKIRSQQAGEIDGGEYPEKEIWEGWQFLRAKLQNLYDDLLDNDHPLAHGLGAILDEMKEAEAKTEYKRATKLLTESALKFVETHDLWNALETEEEEDEKTNLLPDLTLQLIVKLKALRRELDRADHEKADEFGALIDKIPAEVPDFSSIMPAANAVGAATVYATKHSLWDALAPLPKSDEEALFWENNGERYRRLQNLERSLEKTSQEFAPRLTEKLREIDKQINNDNFFLAGVLIDETWDLAKKHDMIDEGPKDIWEGLGQDIAKLRELGRAAKVQDGLRDEGYEHSGELNAYLESMNEAEKALEWQRAVDAYKAGKAYADKHDIWDETNTSPPEEDDDDETDDYPEKTRWENWQFYYDKMRKLYDQLSEMEHPLADRVGAYLDEIDEAAKKKEYQRATDLLVEDAGDFATDNDLWDAVKTDDSDDENLLPDLTLQQIKKLRDLARELKRMDHDHASKFANLVDAIPDVVTDFSGIIPAGRAIGDASTYADANKLWDAVPPLPKGEEEKIFWETNGKQYRALNTLHRNLEAAGHEMAARLGEKLGEVEEAISGDHFHLAMIHLDDATTLADEYKLWDAAPASDNEDDGWLSRLSDLDELRSLVGELVSGGIEGAAEFVGKVSTILKEAAKGNFDTAGELLDTALVRARELAAAHDIGGGGAGSINPSIASISGSVGKGGKNWPADVKTVQMLLNHHGASLKTDSDCGKLTTGAIEKFQNEKFGWKDGKIDPGGKTFGALTGTIAFEEIAETAGEVVRDVSKAAKDAAEAVADAVGDAVEDAGEFFSDLFDADDDDKEKKT